MLDVFNDEKRGGVCIFRVDERLHQFHGSKIWWSPRKSALAPAAAETLANFVKRLHRGEESVTEDGGADENIIGFLEAKFDLSSSHLKGSASLIAHFSPCD